MRVKEIHLNSFKRFTNLKVINIPENAKLIVLVGPNGSGKTSFMEALNHFYKWNGFSYSGEADYLYKATILDDKIQDKWNEVCRQAVNITFHDKDFSTNSTFKDINGHFYFRGAYRNEPSFTITSMTRQNNPINTFQRNTLIQNDQTVSSNYQRLVSHTLDEVYSNSNNTKTVKELREELIGKIRASLLHVFGDLELTGIGDPLDKGNFYFSKGATKNFSYKNLSAGEKSAFDLILDIVIKQEYYQDSIYCIDEPETHMHTRLQGKVLRELYDLIPGKSQLWISTHSIGMIEEARQIESQNPGTVIFLDFGDRDFDEEQVLQPTTVEKAQLDKLYELAFGDFSKLLLPKTIVFCEGDPEGNFRKNFDKSIYSTIFMNTHSEAFFISAGSCTNIENIEKNSGEIIKTLLRNSKIIKIIDRDDRSDQEILELNQKGINVLRKRNLESYLLDDSVIQKLFDKKGLAEKFNDYLECKSDAISKSTIRGNSPDDLKSARNDLYISIKKLLGMTQCGNNGDSFIRDTLAPLITPDMLIYKELEKDIFG